MLAYMIQCHRDFPHVSRLLQWIYDPADSFLLCIDASAVEDRSCLDWIRAKSNIHVIDHHPITWGGPSMLRVMLECVVSALKADNWEYFINISGHDLPLMTREEIVKRLHSQKTQGYVNFIADFGPLSVVPQIAHAGFLGKKVVLGGPSRARIELFGEVCALAMGDAREHHQFLPVTTPKLRPTFLVSEAFEGSLLRCRPYYLFEANDLVRFFKRYPYRFGRQWVIVGRRLCEYIAESAAASDIYARLAKSFIPDEAFFQTVAAAAPEALVGKTLKDNFRYKLGGPELVSDANLEDVLNSGAMFARKLVISESHKLLQWADDRFSRAATTV